MPSVLDMNLASLVDRNTHPLASQIGEKFRAWSEARKTKADTWKEVQEYVFATDTTSTANSSNEHSNSTTRPKLCNLRDNLHANYMSALFPSADWFEWTAGDKNPEDNAKAEAIKVFVKTKVEQSNFEQVMSQLVYDFIDTGNPIVEVEHYNNSYIDDDGEEHIIYRGPRLVRRSIYDLVFDPTAITFEESPKIVRYVKSIGELRHDAEINNDPDAIMALEELKQGRADMLSYSATQLDKTGAYKDAGFGSITEYLESDSVEVLEFRGSITDADGNYLHKHIITVLDRSVILRKEAFKSWTGSDNLYHAGWRLRPDNLYAMGPLENLIGMQYRIDHLENNKADVYDMLAKPPVKVRGEVPEFKLGPDALISIPEDGDVEFMKLPTEALTYEHQITQMEQAMELYVGAPSQSAGVRTAGEKTALEVNTLETNANKMFLNKVAILEKFIVQPALRDYLEIGKRYADSDTYSVMDTDLGVELMVSITKEDLKSRGRLNPMGAKHFARKAKIVQHLQTFLQMMQDPSVKPHVSGIKAAKLFEEVLELDKYSLVKENVGIMEQAETQKIVNLAQQQVAEEADAGGIPNGVPEEEVNNG